MKNLSRAAKNRTDRKLKTREQELELAAEFDWESIKPKLRNEQETRKLMEAVSEATAKNEAVGEVLVRLESLGRNGVELAKKVRKLMIL